LSRTVEIAIGDNFRARPFAETASVAGGITSGFGKLDRRPARGVGNEQISAGTFHRENFGGQTWRCLRIQVARAISMFSFMTARTVIPTIDCASDILVTRMITLVGVRFCVG
jgi:hypothetical protein